MLIFEYLLVLLDGAPELKDYEREIRRREWSWMQLRRRDPSVTDALWEHRMAAHADRVWQALQTGSLDALQGMVSDGLLQSLQHQRDCGQPFEFVSDGRLPVEALNLDVIEQVGPYMVAIARPRWHRFPEHRTKSWAVGAKWFYLRRADGLAPRASGEAGVWEHHCPRCGAALALADRARCTHCGAIVNSGEHDWILVAIGDGEHEHEIFDIPGLDTLQQLDPAFSPFIVEDRAAVIFWALHGARPLRPYLAEGAEIGARQSSALLRLQDIRVHEVRIDRLVVRVRWREGDTDQVEAWTLTRSEEARTPIHRGVASLGCQSCGAPLEGSGTCGYCSAVQAPDAEWRLAAIEPYRSSPPVRPALTRLDTGLSWSERRTVYGVLQTLDKQTPGPMIVFLNDLADIFGYGKQSRRFIERPLSAAAALRPKTQALLLDLAWQMLTDRSDLGEAHVASIRALSGHTGHTGHTEAEVERRLAIARDVQRRVARAKAADEARSES